MSLRRTIAVALRLAEKGAIHRYAITGAVAAVNYIQPTLTEDLDVLVSVAHFEKRQSGLILLGPIEIALAELGYTERSELGFMIEGWPVRFIPSLRNSTKRDWTTPSRSRPNSPAIRR
jgi:hypothetical protein